MSKVYTWSFSGSLSNQHLLFSNQVVQRPQRPTGTTGTGQVVLVTSTPSKMFGEIWLTPGNRSEKGPDNNLWNTKINGKQFDDGQTWFTTWCLRCPDVCKKSLREMGAGHNTNLFVCLLLIKCI